MTDATLKYRSASVHWVTHRETGMVFDVDAMVVHDAVSLDRDILDAAVEPTPRGDVLNALAGKAERRVLEERFDVLVSRNLLLRDGVRPDRAPVARPSNYATFMVNVSQRCNLTCNYCYVNKGHFDYVEKPIPKMSMETAGHLVDRIHDNFPGFHIYGYHFYGGEPLLNFSVIQEIVEHAELTARFTGTETDYHITTNGTLLTPEIADFMEKHRFTVYYSIDSNEDNHDEFRRYLNGHGSYKDVARNLQLLRERKGVHLIGSSVVRDGNSLSSAMESLKAEGSSQCKAERVRLHDDDPLAMDRDAFQDYLDDVHALADHYISYLENDQKPLDYRLTSKILQLLTRKRRDFFCPAGERMFGISSDGELYPCALHVGRPQSVLGDVTNGPDPDKLARFRKKFSAEGQDVCRSCWNRTLCGGGCSAMVDRFGYEKCDSLKAESEAALIVYRHFARTNPIKLLGLVSPKMVQWAEGTLENPEDLALTEPAAELDRGEFAGQSHA